MTDTLATLIVSVSSDLRDISNNTFSTSEISDLINQGIDALSDVYPREIVSNVGTITASTYSYSAGSLTHIYRLEVYSSAGSFVGVIPQGDGSADSGWELHASTVWLPINYSLNTGYVLRGYGYGRFSQLSASSSTTDMDATAIWAMRTYCQAKAFGRLLNDRAKFQQYQNDSNNTDVTPIALAQLWSSARAEWRDEKQRLRRHRKI